MSSSHKNPGIISTQFFTSLISTSLVLILLGTIVLFMLCANNLSTYVRENINVTILLNDDITSEQINSLKNSLSSKAFVKSLKYISKEHALQEQCKDMGTDPSEFLGYNPFTASFEINIKAEYANTSNVHKIIKHLKKSNQVMDVVYQKELMDSVNNNIRKLSVILLVIAVLFTYISFALINNTVSLTIFSKRFIINTMKLVGAHWGFIRRPFLNNALLLGVLSAIIADGIIIGGIYWLIGYEPEIKAVVGMQEMIITSGAVLLFGLIITYLCTFFSLSRYLRMSSNELYHI